MGTPKHRVLEEWLKMNPDGMTYDEQHIRWFGGKTLDAVEKEIKDRTKITKVELWAAPVGVIATVEYKGMKAHVNITNEVILYQLAPWQIADKIIIAMRDTIITEMLQKQTGGNV